MLVSVVVITYGHEKTIGKCLDSILMQEKKFDLEIIVGEDNSPDKTREILKKYEKENPGIFKMIYRDVNIGSRRNSYDCQIRAAGEYVAFCEGDDFWLDKHKLMKQLNFLQSHPKYVACYHNVKVVDNTNRHTCEKRYPSSPLKNYSLFLYDCGYMPSQLASLMMKNLKYNTHDFSWRLNQQLVLPGDRILILILLSIGKIYVMSDVMSAYRYVTNEGFSFSAQKQQENLKEMEKTWLILEDCFKYNKFVKRFCCMKKKLVLFRQRKNILDIIKYFLTSKMILFYISRFVYCYCNKLLFKIFVKKWSYIAR